MWKNVPHNQWSLESTSSRVSFVTQPDGLVPLILGLQLVLYVHENHLNLCTTPRAVLKRIQGESHLARNAQELQLVLNDECLEPVLSVLVLAVRDAPWAVRFPHIDLEVPVIGSKSDSHVDVTFGVVINSSSDQ